MTEPRVLTDWEAHAASDNNLLNLSVELSTCVCEGLCTCDEEEPK